MNILQLLKKRPSLIVYSGIAILAVLISNKLGITIDNLGHVHGVQIGLVVQGFMDY